MSQRYFEGSDHAQAYAKHRPIPPTQIVDRVVSFLKEKYNGPLSRCVDVGCGNGQATGLFSPLFEQVIGTDISPGQIQFAKAGNFPSNVEFKISPAEAIPLPDNSVQLLNSGQACHWFDLPAFFEEANRVLCRFGVISLYGYGLPMFCHDNKEIADQLQELIVRYYSKETEGFWGPGIKELDSEYKNIHIPYKDVVREDIWSDVTIKTLKEYLDYLTTWSGFQNYKNHHGEEVAQDLLNKFSTECKKILRTEEDSSNVMLNYRRKYFLVMGRKD